MTDPYQPPSSAKTRMGQRHPNFRIIGSFEGLGPIQMLAIAGLVFGGTVEIKEWLRGSPLKVDRTLVVGCLFIVAALAQMYPFLLGRLRRRRYFTMPLVASGEALRAGPARLWGTDAKTGRAGHLILTASEVIFLETGGHEEGILHVPVAIAAKTLLKIRDRQLYFRDPAGELIRLEVRNSKAWRTAIEQVANGLRLR